jgi:hypothetical protein
MQLAAFKLSAEKGTRTPTPRGTVCAMDVTTNYFFLIAIASALSCLTLKFSNLSFCHKV